MDAWNRHDADALVAVYAEGGTYHTPRLDHPLTGESHCRFCQIGVDSFSRLVARGRLVEGTPEEAWSPFSWFYTAPTPGPFMDGTPPTGRTVAYPGASFTQIEGDKIRSEHIYLDRQTVAEQLGSQSQVNLTSTGSLRTPNGNRIKQASEQRHAEVGEFSSALNTTFNRLAFPWRKPAQR